MASRLLGVNTNGNKFQWKFSQNDMIFISENERVNAACKMLAVLFRTQFHMNFSIMWCSNWLMNQQNTCDEWYEIDYTSIFKWPFDGIKDPWTME